MKKYYPLFKISAILSYLFFVYGLSQLTLVIQNYWQFFLDPKPCQSCLYWHHDRDFNQDRAWISFCYFKEKMALVYSFDGFRNCTLHIF